MTSAQRAPRPAAAVTDPDGEEDERDGSSALTKSLPSCPVTRSRRSGRRVVRERADECGKEAQPDDAQEDERAESRHPEVADEAPRHSRVGSQQQAQPERG